MRFYKNEGETPLEALNRLRKEKPKYKNSTLSYAGRLDPIAEGILYVLVGKQNKEREKYLNMDKVYEVDIIFGIKTDTGDILGLVKKVESFLKENKAKKGSTFLNEFKGDISLPYPIYSSKIVKGKTLFQLAREGKMKNIKIPIKKSKIYEIKILKKYKMKGGKILSEIKNRIKKVKGDFRQKEIICLWEENLKNRNLEFEIIRIKVKCSSGTYMRSLAEKIGMSKGIFATAWKIKRTAVLQIKAK